MFLIFNRYIAILIIFSLIIFFGALFEKTVERYTYKLIDLIFTLKPQTKCSRDELLELNIRTIKPIRKDNFIESYNDWDIYEKKKYICPKNTVLILIDVWENTNEKNDIFKKEVTRITENIIIPVSNKIRSMGGTIIHSPNGGNIYPNVYKKDEVNLAWTRKLPHNLQTLILFWKLRSKGAKTIIYSGYSTYLCLFDRPHGILYTKYFSKYFSRLLLRDGTTGWQFSDKNPSFVNNFINYLEWKQLPSFSSSDLIN